MTKQIFKLRLYQDANRMTVRRFTQTGELGTKTQWKIGKKSNLPKGLFYMIKNFIQQRIKHCEDKNSFPSVKEAALSGLREAAKACGCTHSVDGAGADILWSLKDVPFLGVQTARQEGQHESAKEASNGRGNLPLDHRSRERRLFSHRGEGSQLEPLGVAAMSWIGGLVLGPVLGDPENAGTFANQQMKVGGVLIQGREKRHPRGRLRRGRTTGRTRRRAHLGNYLAVSDSSKIAKQLLCFQCVPYRTYHNLAF